MKECHRRSFSLSLSTGTLRKALSLSTKDLNWQLREAEVLYNAQFDGQNEIIEPENLPL
jgi:hypothetical protein